MANIYVEGKGPKGPQFKESLLPAAVVGYQRGLCVNYGADAFTAALVSQAAVAAMGILEEDAIDVRNPVSVIEFGQVVAQIGANVARGQSLTPNAAGQLVPALVNQPVVAVSLEDQIFVAPGSFACVFFIGIVSTPA